MLTILRYAPSIVWNVKYSGMGSYAISIQSMVGSNEIPASVHGTHSLLLKAYARKCGVPWRCITINEGIQIWEIVCMVFQVAMREDILRQLLPRTLT